MHFLLTDGLFWTSVVCCAIAQFYIIRSVRGTRYVPEPTASAPRSRDAMEMVWAVLPAIGLAVLLVFTWKAMKGREDVRTWGREDNALTTSQRPPSHPHILTSSRPLP